MTLPSFGIPEAEASAQALEGVVAANSESLMGVVMGALGPVNATVSDNEAGMGRVTGTLNRSLGATVRNNTKKVAESLQQISGSLTATIGAANALMAAAIAAGDPPSEQAPSQPTVQPAAIATSTTPAQQQQCDLFNPASCGTPTGWYFSAIENGYYCLRFYDTNNPSTFPGDIGPFTTADTATLFASTQSPPLKVAFSNDNVTCQIPPTPTPTPTPAPEPTCTKPPTPACIPGPSSMFVFPALAKCGLSTSGMLPPVGSPEFCKCMDVLAASYANLGQKVIDGIFGTLGAGGGLSKGWFSDLIAGAKAMEDASLIGPAIKAFDLAGLLNNIRYKLYPIFQAMLTSPTCNAPVVVGIEFARALFNMMAESSFGLTLPFAANLKLPLRVESFNRFLTYLANYACPTEVPSTEGAMNAWMQNTASEAQVRCWLKMRGVDFDVFEPMMQASRARLSTIERIQFGRRQNPPDSDSAIAESLRDLGWLNANERKAQVFLFDQLPSINDHLHWLQRNVFDRDYVNEFKLTDGFEQRFWPAFGNDLRAQGVRKIDAQHHFEAHWVNPGPDQLREMVARLRPGRVDPSVQFTADQYEKILQEQDVGSFFRPRFKALIYRVPAIRFLRQSFQNGTLNAAEFIGYLEDMGFNAKDAARIVETEKVLKVQHRASISKGWTPQTLAKAISVGLIDVVTLKGKMFELGFTETESNELIAVAQAELQHEVAKRSLARQVSTTLQEIRNAQLVGAMDIPSATNAIVGLGFLPAQAQSIATITDASRRLALVREGVRKLRGAFLSGEITQTQARTGLQTLGITADAQAGYLSTWALEATPNRRRRTAGSIVRDVGSGALTVADATTRLHNLGYEAADILLFLHDASVSADAKKQKLADKLASKTAKQDKAALARKQKRAVAQAHADLSGKPKVIGEDGKAVILEPSESASTAPSSSPAQTGTAPPSPSSSLSQPPSAGGP